MAPERFVSSTLVNTAGPALETGRGSFLTGRVLRILDAVRA